MQSRSRYKMQRMLADYKILGTTSYRYKMQRMLADYQILGATSALKLDLSTK